MPRSRKSPARLAAERAHRESQFAIRAHRKHCARCNQALKLELYANACDLGWSYLKLERQAAAQLRDAIGLERAQLAGQGTLW